MNAPVMGAAVPVAGRTDPWSRRRARKAAPLARIAQWMKGHVLETGAIVEALQTLLEPGEAVALEGDNQKQADFLKIASALALARRDCENGKPMLPVLLLETGGVRLQEANLGKAGVAEIHAEIVALRRLVPVIGVITGMIGCFGGMSITAGLCSYLVVLPQARLELNGPEVIEQEAGIDELDASDKHPIWSLMGGEQRYETGFVDALIEDDAKALRQTIQALAVRGVPTRHRSEKIASGSTRQSGTLESTTSSRALRTQSSTERTSRRGPVSSTFPRSIPSWP